MFMNKDRKSKRFLKGVFSGGSKGVAVTKFRGMPP